MELAYNSQEDLAHALRSCPVLCTELGPQGLACLATSSKYCRDAVDKALCKDRRHLLAAASTTAHSTGRHVHFKAVAWLAIQLLQREVKTAADVTEQLLNLPSARMPLSMAKQLVSAGVRISYSQLLAASNNMVEGVEVWVQAQQVLGVKSDIPGVAVAICCGCDWVSGARYLRLAMSCTSAAEVL
jgi:hypothetical protein